MDTGASEQDVKPADATSECITLPETGGPAAKYDVCLLQYTFKNMALSCLISAKILPLSLHLILQPEHSIVNTNHPEEATSLIHDGLAQCRILWQAIAGTICQVGNIVPDTGN